MLRIGACFAGFVAMALLGGCKEEPKPEIEVVRYTLVGDPEVANLQHALVILQNGECLAFLKASGDRFELVNGDAVEDIYEGHISPIGREPVKDKDGWMKLVKLEEVISEIEDALKKH